LEYPESAPLISAEATLITAIIPIQTFVQIYGVFVDMWIHKMKVRYASIDKQRNLDIFAREPTKT